VLVLALVLSVAGMQWGYAEGVAHAGSGPIWRQVLAVLYGYGAFLAVMTVALLLRQRLLAGRWSGRAQGGGAGRRGARASRPRHPRARLRCTVAAGAAVPGLADPAGGGAGPCAGRAGAGAQDPPAGHGDGRPVLRCLPPGAAAGCPAQAQLAGRGED